MKLAAIRRIRIAPDVLARVVDDEMVLLNLKTEHYIGFDQVATRMWTVLNESDSVEEAFRTLADEYEVPGDTLRSDLDAFIDNLLDHQLIEVHAG